MADVKRSRRRPCKSAFAFARRNEATRRSERRHACERARHGLDAIGVRCTALWRWHWVAGEARRLPVDSAGERPVGASLTPFLGSAVAAPLAGQGQSDCRMSYAGNSSNRGNASSVGATGGSGAPRASRPPGWLACRSKRLNSCSNLPVFHWPYRQVQSFCRRRKVWQSMYLRSSGASRFIRKLRMYLPQTDRVSQIRQSRKMSLSPCGFYGMILFGGRAVFNGRLENISTRRCAVCPKRREAAEAMSKSAPAKSGRATDNIKRDGRTETCGLQYYSFN